MAVLLLYKCKERGVDSHAKLFNTRTERVIHSQKILDVDASSRLAPDDEESHNALN
jgi:hypothetical protein